VLKIKVARDFALSLGWDSWVNVLGLRHGEARRVARARAQRERWEVVAPLHEAGVTREHVAAFWAAQDFDLGLPAAGGKTPLGNCDLCFLKSAATISAILRERPELAEWWVRMETVATPLQAVGGALPHRPARLRRPAGRGPGPAGDQLRGGGRAGGVLLPRVIGG
jgi:hypothetical protein